MPRPPRPDIEDGWHHIMNRGIDHGDVFFTDEDRVEFGQRLADVHERFGVRTHAYCLLGNHFHLLWHCPDGGLSSAMQRVGSLYTRHVNDRLGRDGALFRGRFHSRLITSEAHLLAAVRYIHRNALDVEGIERARDYRWSSHRTYLGLRARPSWLETDLLLAGLTAEQFDRFVEDPLGGSLESTAVDVLSLVAAAELILAERGLCEERRLGAVARQMSLAWLVERTSMSEVALMDAFGFERRGALRTAVSRARALLRSEPLLAEAQSCAVSLSAKDCYIRGLTQDVIVTAGV